MRKFISIFNLCALIKQSVKTSILISFSEDLITDIKIDIGVKYIVEYESSVGDSLSDIFIRNFT